MIMIVLGYYKCEEKINLIWSINTILVWNKIQLLKYERNITQKMIKNNTLYDAHKAFSQMTLPNSKKDFFGGGRGEERTSNHLSRALWKKLTTVWN